MSTTDFSVRSGAAEATGSARNPSLEAAYVQFKISLAARHPLAIAP